MPAPNPRPTDLSDDDRQGSDEASERLPEEFGRYQIIERLGQGGMGSVYLAEDTQLGRRVALKVPEFGPHDGPEARKRFLEEARAAATLDHPNLCRVYDAGEVHGQFYLTMAYIEGQSLKASISDQSRTPQQAAALVGKLAQALQVAHARGVIHRDLKPANIMIKTKGQRREPVIVDFGLAHRVNREKTRLTKAGQVMGTLAYMAPEQIRGDLKEIGPACDIYALGVILYELLTGRLPFSGTGLAVAGQILTQAPMPPSTHRSDLDPALEAICLKAMAKQFEDRYASMSELVAALTDYLRSSSTPAAPTAPASSPASPPPTAGEPPQPTGSDSLVAEFFERLATEKDSLPSIPTPESGSSPLTLSERLRPPWVWASLVAGLMLLALVVAWVAGGFKGKDKNDGIVLGNVPKRAEALRDGERVPVQRPTGGGFAEIRTPPDRRKLEVKKDVIPTFIEPKRPDPDGAPQVSPVPPPVPDVSVNPPAPAIAESEPPPTEPMPDARPTQAPEKGPKKIASRSARPGDRRQTTQTPDGGFQPLFNGKDLSGWKAAPKQRGNWHVANGVLVGSGPALSHLYTERGDFTDFHLRVEARFNEGGSGGVYLRCPFGPSVPADDPKWPDGFEATINNARIVRESTGGLYPGVGNDVFTADFGKVTSVPFGQWFTLEVIAEGNALAVLVNGESSAYKFPSPRLHPSGHIALQQYSPETVIEFRKIEIKELNRSNQKDSKEIGRFPSNTDRMGWVDFSPDGLGILSAESAAEFTRKNGGGNYVFFSHAYALRMWDVASGRNRFTVRGEGGAAAALALSADGRYAASSRNRLTEHGMLIWDLKTGQRIHRLLPKDTINIIMCTRCRIFSGRPSCHGRSDERHRARVGPCDRTGTTPDHSQCGTDQEG